MPDHLDSPERIVITPGDVTNAPSAGSSASQITPTTPAGAPVSQAPPPPPAVPWWGILISAFLAFCLPILCIFALAVRLALRGRDARLRLAWNSLLCTLLIVSGLITSVSFAWLWTFRPGITARRATSIEPSPALEMLDTLPAFPQLPAQRAMTPVDLAARTKPLVFIVTPDTTPQTRDLEFASIGAAMLLLADESGYLLGTNRHVIEAGGIFPRRRNPDQVIVTSSGGGSAYAAVVGRHRDLDLAMLWIARHAGQGAFRQPIAAYHSIPVGEPVFVIGHPQRLFFTLSNGLVSRFERGGILQISAPISPGNSGGPAYDSLGNLLGVVTYKLDRESSPNAENLNFATRADAFLTEVGWDFRADGATLLRRLTRPPSN